MFANTRPGIDSPAQEPELRKTAEEQVAQFAEPAVRAAVDQATRSAATSTSLTSAAFSFGTPTTDVSTGVENVSQSAALRRAAVASAIASQAPLGADTNQLIATAADFADYNSYAATASQPASPSPTLRRAGFGAEFDQQNDIAQPMAEPKAFGIREKQAMQLAQAEALQQEISESQEIPLRHANALKQATAQGRANAFGQANADELEQAIPMGIRQAQPMARMIDEAISNGIPQPIGRRVAQPLAESMILTNAQDVRRSAAITEPQQSEPLAMSTYRERLSNSERQSLTNRVAVDNERNAERQAFISASFDSWGDMSMATQAVSRAGALEDIGTASREAGYALSA